MLHAASASDQSAGGAFPPEDTLLIPAFDEETRLGRTLDRVLGCARLAGAQLVVIDDGSTDGTVGVALERLRDRPGAHILMSPSNKGKGAAIRKGMVVAQGRKVLVMGAGAPEHLDALDDMLGRLDAADVVIAPGVRPGPAPAACTLPTRTAGSKASAARSRATCSATPSPTATRSTSRSCSSPASSACASTTADGRPRSGAEQGPPDPDPLAMAAGGRAGALPPPRHDPESQGRGMSGVRVSTSLSVGFVAWRDLASPNAGGSEVVVDAHLRGLQARGHDVL